MILDKLIYLKTKRNFESKSDPTVRPYCKTAQNMQDFGFLCIQNEGLIGSDFDEL